MADMHIEPERTGGSYFVAPDGYDEPTLWLINEGLTRAVLRLCDLPSEARHLWPTIVRAAIGGAA